MNYFEHEYDVKFVDGLLGHSQEWQWIIDYIEERYTFNEVKTWEEFISESYSLRDLVQRFVKILNICDREWKIDNVYVKDAWNLAKYVIGIMNAKTTRHSLSTTEGKALLLCFWITKLINQNNENNNEFDIRVLHESNVFQICRLDFINDEIGEINNFIDSIPYEGISLVKQTLNNNVNGFTHEADSVFFAQVKDLIRQNKLFNYNGLQIRRGSSWQENLVISLMDRRPQKQNDDGFICTYKKEDIIRARKDLNDEDVSFVLETVLFYGFDITPHDDCIIRHCEIICTMMNSGDELLEILRSYSIKIISKVFEEKTVGEWRQSDSYKLMICQFHRYRNPQDIRKIINCGIPISKEQRKAYKEYSEKKYKQIDEILVELSDYFEDEDVILNINDSYLSILRTRFNELVDHESVAIRVANVFYDYMVFLIRINQSNIHIDKRWIQPEMLRIKKLWSTNYYIKAVAEMQVFSQETSVPVEEIDKYNNHILNNPIIFANTCLAYDEKRLLDHMISVANSPMSLFFTSMELSVDFPKKDQGVIFERHDIDCAFLNVITDIEKRKGYKLLNQLDPRKFVAAIYKRYKMQTQINVSFFNKDKDLYELVQSKTSIKMLEYNDEITLAMVTQLFPLLEMKVRELVSLFGVFPYQIKENDFMKANDPSSLLREILLQIYKEQNGFENVPDLMFVYNTMYNNNFLNIRNDCIHGRGYCDGGSLRYAFKVTLLSIYMIIFRIETIKENVSDLIELE